MQELKIKNLKGILILKELMTSNKREFKKVPKMK
jgi:hypothetical protein